MAGINKAIIVGYLGKDPDARQLTKGTVTSFSVATSENWTDKMSGEKKENTQWHKIVCYGRLADVAKDYLLKGRLVYIEGKIQTRKWQNKEGIDQYTTEIIANDLQLLDKKLGQSAHHDSSDYLPTQDLPVIQEDEIPF